MRRILRSRPSPAMVVASLALVVALGGVAFASIPGRGGVIKGCYSKSTGSLRVIDSKKSCSKKRERTLSWNQQGIRGLQGIQGPQGIQGLAGQNGKTGADATKLFAWVSNKGEFHGSGVTGVQHTALSGDYNVTFNRDLANCVVEATEGDGYPSASGASAQAGSRVEASLSYLKPTNVHVQTVSNDGALSERPFHVAVFC
jgi:hypothetical protein